MIKWFVLKSAVGSDQVDQLAEAVLPVEQLQHRSVGEGDGEEHGGVTDAGRVGRLQQPQSVGHQVEQHAVRERAHLQTDTSHLVDGSQAEKVYYNI